MASNLHHIKTVEGLIQAADGQIEIMKANNSQQVETIEDARKAINEFQSTELLALRRACEPG